MRSGLLMSNYIANLKEAHVVEQSPDGRYIRYNEILGSGAFKDVYKGYNKTEKREVAWNQICVDDDGDLDAVEKSCAEAVLLKSLDHRSIMGCYCYWVDAKNKTINIITELLGCGSLRQYRRKHGFVDIEVIKRWAKQILEGLQYLHCQNPPIIHRDIKGDNIFVHGDQGEVKIGDFGLAATSKGDRSVVGSPAFMAPELYEEEYNELVDIYAFGMCLLELVTGEYPYSECQNPGQVYRKVSTGVKPAALAKVKDAEVKEFIEKCLVPLPLRLPASELLKDPFLASATRSEERYEPQISADSTTEDYVFFNFAVKGCGNDDFRIGVSIEDYVLCEMKLGMNLLVV